MMNRMEGRSFIEAASVGADGPGGAVLGAVLAAMVVGVVGTGPDWFLNVSCGAAISARVSLIVGREEGGEAIGDA